MEDLVDAVESHLDFHGTRALYMNEFWNLMQETLVTPNIVQQRIDRLLKVNELVTACRSAGISVLGIRIESSGRLNQALGKRARVLLPRQTREEPWRSN